MLSVIVEAGGEGERLPGVLAALTSAAVEGLVRDVAIVGGGPAELLAVLREETGAELATDTAQAIAAAKSDLLLVIGADFRPRAGWLEALAAHLRNGGREGVLAGEGGGFLKLAPYGVLIGKAKAAALAHPDLPRLRRSLGRGPRIG
ncbi:MAG: hypothetical protein E7812_01175 [Phenylobacterium sp.]|nr:MAG: hypothetical protein E7812_01175 [Phenylobacterium sp.]